MKEIFDSIADVAKARMQKAVEDGAKQVALIMSGVFVLVCGLLFLVVASYFFLVPVTSREGAALIVAGLLIVIGAILLATAHVRHGNNGRNRGRAPARDAKTEANADLTQAVLEREVAHLIRKNAKTATIVALLAGAALGASPELRRALLRQLDRRQKD